MRLSLHFLLSARSRHKSAGGMVGASLSQALLYRKVERRRRLRRRTGERSKNADPVGGPHITLSIGDGGHDELVAAPELIPAARCLIAVVQLDGNVAGVERMQHRGR